MGERDYGYERDEAITQPGDLWILGKHRLLCGDSSRPEDVDRLLPVASVRLSFPGKVYSKDPHDG